MERKRAVPAVVASILLHLASLAGAAAQPLRPPAPLGPAILEAQAVPALLPALDGFLGSFPPHPPASLLAQAAPPRPAAASQNASEEEVAEVAVASFARSQMEPAPSLADFSAATGLEGYRQAAGLLLKVDADRGVPRSPYGELIYDVALRHSLNPHLIAAVIHVESAFNPRAVSRKGACGLMQLLPSTARRFGLRKRKDLFDPAKNVEAGVRYLKWLTRRFSGDVQKILAAYNAGEGAVERFGGIPPYRETQQYVRRVFSLLKFSPDLPEDAVPAAGAGGGLVAAGK